MADYSTNGQGIMSGQIGSSIITVVLIFLIMMTIEVIYGASQAAGDRFQVLMDYTASSESMSLVIHQDASKYKEAKPLGLSVNERTGIEFAYSFFINVFPSTFNGEEVFKHVFHKGYGCPWPLMGPGVFMHGHQNTMRVVMNTYKGVFKYVDITNIPIQKWVHVVLNCSKVGLDVFVNGKLANRIPFEGTMPYQNFQDIILFSNANYNTLRGSQIAALDGNDFIIQGAFKGQLSKLIYTRYSLSMAEIQNLLSAGPAREVRTTTNDNPPYLADDWWAHQA